MNLNELYTEYGKAVLTLEIAQNRVIELKKAIIEEANKKAEVKDVNNV